MQYLDEFLEAFDTAVAGIEEKVYVRFNRVLVQYSESLNKSTQCHNQELWGACGSDCGALAQCHTLHHRSAYKLLGINSNNTIHTIRFVNYSLCSYDSDEQMYNSHRVCYGMSVIGGKESIVSRQEKSLQLANLIKHELYHSLGAEDNCGSSCIMDDIRHINKLCNECRELIANETF